MRRTLGLSRKGLDEQLGYAWGRTSRWERGEGGIPLAHQRLLESLVMLQNFLEQLVDQERRLRRAEQRLAKGCPTCGRGRRAASKKLPVGCL